MKKLLLITFMLFAASAFAQVNVQFAWDASDTPSTAENPIRYYLYQCSDIALTNCAQHDADTALTYGPISLTHASTTWFYATARNFSLEVDGTPTGDLQESPKSNILQVKAFSPPGNPKNQRIQVVQIGESTSDFPLYAELK